MVILRYKNAKFPQHLIMILDRYYYKMDLSKFLSGSSNGGSNNIDDLDKIKVSEVAKEGQWRDKLYKRKGVNFTTNTKETRTLRSMQVHF